MNFKDDFTKKLESIHKSSNINSFKDLKKTEQEVLKNLDQSVLLKRENELKKHKNLLFQQELKSKRIKKIKSKIYRKHKKRREMKDHIKMLSNLDDPALIKQEIEKAILKRAEVRL